MWQYERYLEQITLITISKYCLNVCIFVCMYIFMYVCANVGMLCLYYVIVSTVSYINTRISLWWSSSIIVFAMFKKTSWLLIFSYIQTDDLSHTPSQCLDPHRSYTHLSAGNNTFPKSVYITTQNVSSSTPLVKYHSMYQHKWRLIEEFSKYSLSHI